MSPEAPPPRARWARRQISPLVRAVRETAQWPLRFTPGMSMSSLSGRCLAGQSHESCTFSRAARSISYTLTNGPTVIFLLRHGVSMGRQNLGQQEMRRDPLFLRCVPYGRRREGGFVADVGRRCLQHAISACPSSVRQHHGRKLTTLKGRMAVSRSQRPRLFDGLLRCRPVRWWLGGTVVGNLRSAICCPHPGAVQKLYVARAAIALTGVSSRRHPILRRASFAHRLRGRRTLMRVPLERHLR